MKCESISLCHRLVVWAGKVQKVIRELVSRMLEDITALSASFMSKAPLESQFETLLSLQKG